MSNQKIIVMGVSGSGKSLIGKQLACALGMAYFDADNYHSKANVQKMTSGVPLDDNDRAGWLEDLATLIQREPSLILGCSALKRRYRDKLREKSPELIFLYLQGDFDTIRSRLERRENHYFTGEAMLRSQFALLEPPDEDEARSIDIRQSPEEIVKECLAVLERQPTCYRA